MIDKNLVHLTQLCRLVPVLQVYTRAPSRWLGQGKPALQSSRLIRSRQSSKQLAHAPWWMLAVKLRSAAHVLTPESRTSIWRNAHPGKQLAQRR